MNLPYLSQTPGIGGRLKEFAEDFVVEEITLQGKVLRVGKKVRMESEKGEFAHFVLQKRNWNTLQALKEISWKLGVSQKRFGYAGTKDRVALTTQLCSAWGVEPKQFRGLSLKDIGINGAWSAAGPVKMGDLLGNHFTIAVRGIVKGAKRKVAKIRKELGGLVPNYFGEQRFGSVRANTHIVGKLIVSGNFESAVMTYLCSSEGEGKKEARDARERLASEMDFQSALRYFPAHLKYERTLIAHLAEHKNDHVGALRRLPRGLSLMFVHAYQSYLFNRMLAKRVSEGRLLPEKGALACPAGPYGFPEVGKASPFSVKKAKGRFAVGRIIGYESGKLSAEEGEALASEGIAPEAFFIKSFPEISAKGALRPLFVPLKDFRFKEEKEMGRFSFALPAGSYATVAMREFIDGKVV